MNQRERFEYRPPNGGGGSDNPGEGLDQLRQRADRFLSAGDDAINRALGTTNSETFLRASRQQGGE